VYTVSIETLSRARIFFFKKWNFSAFDANMAQHTVAQYQKNIEKKNEITNFLSSAKTSGPLLSYFSNVYNMARFGSNLAAVEGCITILIMLDYIINNP
jgi:hypothetical protein